MKKHYFELDKVNSITLTGEAETMYRWYPEIPARPKTFLGIKYGMYEAIPAGWGEGNNLVARLVARKKSSYFDDFYTSYKVCDITKKIYIKAQVEIRFNHKESFVAQFEDNTEAQNYVDELIESSDKQFHVMINKK